MSKKLLYPKIIKFKEKHFDRVFLLQNSDEEGRMYLKVLSDRFEAGNYEYLRSHEMDLYVKIKDTIEEDNAKKAMVFIQKFNRGEYEGYEKVDFETV